MTHAWCMPAACTLHGAYRHPSTTGMLHACMSHALFNVMHAVDCMQLYCMQASYFCICTHTAYMCAAHMLYTCFMYAHCTRAACLTKMTYNLHPWMQYSCGLVAFGWQGICRQLILHVLMYVCMSAWKVYAAMHACPGHACGNCAEWLQFTVHVARFERTCTMCTELIFVKDKKDVVQ